MFYSDTVLLSTTYLGPIQYYCKLLGYKSVWIEIYENYSKQSYRNRCDILGANGRLTLSIPIKREKTLKVLTRDIRIDYSSRWQAVHWRAIESAYRSSPFFIYYADDIAPFYKKKVEHLVDYNLQLQETILNLLGIESNARLTEDYISDSKGQDDFRESIHPKQRMQKTDCSFVLQPYYQVFENKFKFEENLSIIDLLFNMGPSAASVLENSCKIQIQDI